MLQAWVKTATQFWGDFTRGKSPNSLRSWSQHAVYQTRVGPLHRVRRVSLSDGVARTLFEDYASHRHEARGEEETGWILLGLREKDAIQIRATLPAGAKRDAGASHVLFNSEAQVLGIRYLWQLDKRLMMLGVVHTHPGSLRHPSDMDFRGDSEWVGKVRGGMGVFGIGTADAPPSPDALYAWRPRPHVQCLGDLRFSWYRLELGARKYEPLPVEIAIGPNLARPLHAVWSTVEAHAEGLNRLAQQQNNVAFEIAPGKSGQQLLMRLPLAEPYESLCVFMQESDVRYLLMQKDKWVEVDLKESRVERGVYLLLAELAH